MSKPNPQNKVYTSYSVEVWRDWAKTFLGFDCRWKEVASVETLQEAQFLYNYHCLVERKWCDDVRIVKRTAQTLLQSK